MTDVEVFGSVDILDVTAALIVVVRPPGTIVYVNPALCRATGFERDDLVGRDLFDTIVPEMVRAELRDAMRELRRGSVSATHTSPLRTSAGELLTVEWTNTVVTDAAGKIDLVVATGVDVTAREEATQALRASEARYRAMAEHSSDMIATLTPSGMVSYVSIAACDHTGYAPEELIGTNLLTLVPDDHRDAVRKALERAREDGGLPVVFPLSRRDGHETWLEMAVTPVLGPAGVVLELVAVARDVSERRRFEEELQRSHESLEEAVRTRTADLEREMRQRARAEETLRQSEAKYRALMDEAPMAILLCDGTGRVLEANRRARALFGLDGAHGADGGEGVSELALPTDVLHDVRDLLPQVVRGRVEHLLVNASPGSGGMMHDLPLTLGNGRVVPMDATWSTFDLRGQRLHQCILRDISEHKAQERELRRAKDRAEAADRSKSEFLANMSHELRTPLNAIIGFSDIMATELLGPMENDAYRGYAKDIRDSGAHLLGVINEILDMSKVEAGQLDLHPERVDVGDMVRQALRYVSERAATAGVVLSTELAEPLPDLYADARRIRQVLLNLLSNAVKFTPAEGRVTVRARTVDNGMTIAVADTGIGMRRSDVAKALQPFGQVDSRLARRFEGTGLGLPLAKAFVESHGGTLDIRSAPRQGTTITIWMPTGRLLPPQRSTADAPSAS